MGSDYEAAERLARGIPLREALDTSSAEAWTALDLGVRVLAWTTPGLLPSHDWADSRRLRWSRDAQLPSVKWSRTPPDEPLLAVALCHPDGRIREAALEWAARSPALRPLLAVRCADWAGPVRDRARALFSEIPGRQLPPLTALVLRLSRRDQGKFARERLDRVLREGPAEDVAALLTSEDRATRRFAYRIAVDRGLLAPAALARTAAAASDDVRIQTLCAEAAIAGMRDGAHDEVLGPLLSARSPQVRSAGVTALRRAGRQGEAAVFLADRSGVVRACARYVLRQGGIDPLPLYRSMCAAPAARPAAPAGLGECGTREDAPALWSLVTHPVPAVRVHAVTGLRALDVVGYEQLRPLLDDPSPAVVRAVTQALLPDADRIPHEWLLVRTGADRPRALRVAAERLLRAHLRATVRQWRPTG
ncbi:hypothetical protein [Streptomyces sp. NBC_01320]|uniref:hypothetical protein n=1 Tax=Streptomyces sp. NBC_01320 TaxID=2903824 RepID=UPI002E157BEA|nr:hypothetical protein OG395_40490 [Streptomyces sp. NBC_01320]